MLGLLLLCACSKPVATVTVPAICTVHHAALTDALVPVHHGRLNAGRVTGYEGAREDLFPHSVIPQLKGELHEVTLESHCVQCSHAELQWIFVAFDGSLSGDDAVLPTFYEVPARIPAPGELGPESCELHGARFEVVLTPTVGDIFTVPIPGYREAEPVLFPHRASPQGGWEGTLSTVSHCPACSSAEREWVTDVVGPHSCHPVYDVPPALRVD